MATTIPQIDALLTVRSEDEHLEFKEASNNFHFEDLVDYCVALANEGGGRMLLGFNSAKLNFEILFADKKSNSAGLQLADLVARPIGLSVLRPEQPNRAFDAVKPKLLVNNGRVDGWGLKCFS